MAPDLTSLLLRKGVGTMADDRAACGTCGRTPLVGELLHKMESGGFLCELCFGRLPEEERSVVSSERIPAGERPLPGVTRAA